MPQSSPNHASFERILLQMIQTQQQLVQKMQAKEEMDKKMLDAIEKLENRLAPRSDEVGQAKVRMYDNLCKLFVSIYLLY